MKELSSKKIKNIYCGVNFALAIVNDGRRKNFHERSYSPINNFSSRKQYNQHSLEVSPQQ